MAFIAGSATSDYNDLLHVGNIYSYNLVSCSMPSCIDGSFTAFGIIHLLQIRYEVIPFCAMSLVLQWQHTEIRSIRGYDFGE